MAKLAELLSGSSKQNLLSTIERGDVIRLKLTPDEGITPKNEGDDSRNKYFIVLGKTSDGKLIGFVVINSQINKNLSEPLQQLHYPLAVSKYAFLLKNRYADCGELKEITLDNFADRYNCRSFGKIDEEDLRLITEAVKTSPKETKKHLREFGLIE